MRHQNSCPIDNYFILLLLNSDLVLEKLVEGDQSKGKEMWANYLYSERHISEVKNASGCYNTFGTEH